MNITLIAILIIYFIGIAISFFVGYRIGKKSTNSGDGGFQGLPYQGIDVVSEGDKSTVGEIESNEDIINHEGVGIIHRPTVEELERMKESQAIKDAKAAMEETIRNTPEPTI